MRKSIDSVRNSGRRKGGRPYWRSEPRATTEADIQSPSPELCFSPAIDRSSVLSSRHEDLLDLCERRVFVEPLSLPGIHSP